MSHRRQLMEVCSIVDLNPQEKRWVIHCRVTSKSKGQRITVDLKDASGEIRGVAFDELVQKVNRLLEVDKEYFISGRMGCLMNANKKYNSLDHNYEIRFKDDTCIKESTVGGDNRPTVQDSFVRLSEVPLYKDGTYIDVAGIAERTGSLQYFPHRERNAPFREITLIDDSAQRVTVKLWNKVAEEFDGSNNPVLVLKDVKVKFSGVNGTEHLSTDSSTLVQINPELEVTENLNRWYYADDSSTSTRGPSSISSTSPAKGKDEMTNLDNQDSSQQAGHSNEHSMPLENSEAEKTYRIMQAKRNHEDIQVSSSSPKLNTASVQNKAKEGNGQEEQTPGQPYSSYTSTESDVHYAFLTANKNEWYSALHFLGEDSDGVSDKIKERSFKTDVKLAEHVQGIDPEASLQGTGYKFFTVRQKKAVVLKCSHMGSFAGGGSLYETFDLLKLAKKYNWSLKTIFVVGCCGATAKDKLDLGSVFVANKVYYYGLGTIVQDQTLENRFDPHELPGNSAGKLETLGGKGVTSIPQIFSVSFLSGDFVMKGENSAEAKRMPLNEKQVGYEMEGIGAVTAVKLYNKIEPCPSPNIALIKGVSDGAGSKKNEKALISYFSHKYEVEESIRQQMCTVMSLTVALRAICDQLY